MSINILFDQSVFIRKNTPELVKALENLGYRNSNLGPSTNNSIATTAYTGQYTFIMESEYDDPNPRINWKIDGARLDCKYNEELFLAIAALRDDTDYMQWFIIPNTKTIPIPGYCGQQGMNGYQRIITSVEYHKYDRKDSRISDIIKFEREDGETILPRKLNIEELKLWFNHKIMNNPYKDDPKIKYYTNNIR